MKIRNLTLVIFVLMLKISSIDAQVAKEEITIRKNIFAVNYYQGSNRLGPAEMRDVLAANPKAAKAYKGTTTTKVASNIFGFVGGYFIGLGIGSKLRYSNDSGSEAILIGAAIVLPSLLMESNANKRRKLAVDYYNKGLKDGSTTFQEEVRLSFTGNGFCLTF